MPLARPVTSPAVKFWFAEQIYMSAKLHIAIE